MLWPAPFKVRAVNGCLCAVCDNRLDSGQIGEPVCDRPVPSLLRRYRPVVTTAFNSFDCSMPHCDLAITHVSLYCPVRRRTSTDRATNDADPNLLASLCLFYHFSNAHPRSFVPSCPLDRERAVLYDCGRFGATSGLNRQLVQRAKSRSRDVPDVRC